MDLVNRSSVFTLSTAFITPMLTLLHPAKWPLGPTLSFPFVKQLSRLFPSHFAHLPNSYPAFTPYQGFPPVISEAAYFLEQPLVFIQVSTQPNTWYMDPLYPPASWSISKTAAGCWGRIPFPRQLLRSYGNMITSQFKNTQKTYSLLWSPPSYRGKKSGSLIHHPHELFYSPLGCWEEHCQFWYQLSGIKALCKERLQTLASTI